MSIFEFQQSATDHRQSGSQTTNVYFFQYWGLGGPRSRCWQIQNLARVHFLLIDKASSLCVLARKKGQEFSSQSLFIRVWISFVDTHFHDLMNLRKFHILILTLEGVRSSHEFRGCISIYPKTHHVSLLWKPGCRVSKERK